MVLKGRPPAVRSYQGCRTQVSAPREWVAKQDRVGWSRASARACLCDRHLLVADHGSGRSLFGCPARFLARASLSLRRASRTSGLPLRGLDMAQACVESPFIVLRDPSADCLQCAPIVRGPTGIAQGISGAAVPEFDKPVGLRMGDPAEEVLKFRAPHRLLVLRGRVLTQPRSLTICGLPPPGPPPEQPVVPEPPGRPSWN